jgi:hypothetical protein
MKLQGQKRDKKKGITLAVHLEQYCGSLLVQPAQNLQTFSLHGKEQEHSMAAEYTTQLSQITLS